jgi:hypothetical protein
MKHQTGPILIKPAGDVLYATIDLARYVGDQPHGIENEE